MPLSHTALAALALSVSVTAAAAQGPNTLAAPGHADPYARDPYITSTGATVANPGQPQSGGTTPQMRAIQRENNTIDKSICKGC